MVGETVIVETKYGPVRGAKKKSFMDDDYYSFLKIPYAQPPIGELRFKDPRPPKPWKLPIDATLQGPSSVHFSIVHNAIEGSEDCLHINIYTKNVTNLTIGLRTKLKLSNLLKSSILSRFRHFQPNRFR